MRYWWILLADKVRGFPHVRAPFLQIRNHMAKPILLKNKTGMNGLGAGVWNIGPGNDPFGGPTREAIPMLDRLPLLAEAGMTYYEAHDTEITAADAPKAAKIAKQLGLKCAMYTPSFFAA